MESRTCRFCGQEDKVENLIGINNRWFHLDEPSCYGSRCSVELSKQDKWNIAELLEDREVIKGVRFDTHLNPKAFLTGVREYLKDLEIPDLDDLEDLEEDYADPEEALYDPKDSISVQEKPLTQEADPVEIVRRDREILKLKEELSQSKKLYQASLKEQDFKLPDWLLNIEEYQLQKALKVEPYDITLSEGGKRETTALLTLSDWHFFKTIRYDVVNGRNEYNIEIAKRRWATVIGNAKKRLIATHKESGELKTLLVWFGGDFIENYLRPENRTKNHGTPTHEMFEALGLLKSALLTFKELEFLREIRVVCSAGNHGRMPETRKTPVSTRTDESLEQLMYWILQKDCEDTRTRIIVKPSYKTYIKVYDKGLCFHHGDAIRYGGGIHGITVPISKHIAKTQQSDPIKVHYHVIGHFHSLHTLPDALVNGCGCGFDETAEQFGFGFESPQQILQLFDSKRGRCGTTPIFAE